MRLTIRFVTDNSRALIGQTFVEFIDLSFMHITVELQLGDQLSVTIFGVLSSPTFRLASVELLIKQQQLGIRWMFTLHYVAMNHRGGGNRTGTTCAHGQSDENLGILEPPVEEPFRSVHGTVQVRGSVDSKDWQGKIIKKLGRHFEFALCDVESYDY